MYSQNDLIVLAYTREGKDRLVRLEKDKKNDWTKLPTSKKARKMKRIKDRSVLLDLHAHVHLISIT